MALKKLCSKTGCNKVIGENIKYCTKHQHLDKERYKEYQRKRLLDKEQKKYQELYSSKVWERIREIIIYELNGMDIYEYYINGKIISGERVHHIIELNEDWSYALDLSNLIYLTERNHRRIHSAYELNPKKRKSMQKLLFKLLERFYKEFS